MAAVDAERIDLWSFIPLARERLADRVPGADVRATEVLLRINRASSLITYDLEARYHRPEGRSWAAFRLMYVLWLAGPLEAHRLAGVAGMSRAAVSNLVGPLVAQGVLVRERHPDDGRAILLGLTDAGRDATRAAYEAQHARERAWVGALTAAEQEALLGLLGKLVDARADIEPTARP